MKQQLDSFWNLDLSVVRRSPGQAQWWDDWKTSALGLTGLQQYQKSKRKSLVDSFFKRPKSELADIDAKGTSSGADEDPGH